MSSGRTHHRMSLAVIEGTFANVAACPETSIAQNTEMRRINQNRESGLTLSFRSAKRDRGSADFALPTHLTTATPLHSGARLKEAGVEHDLEDRMNRFAMATSAAAAVILAAGTVLAAPTAPTKATTAKAPAAKASVTKASTGKASTASTGPSNIDGKLLRVDVANHTVTTVDGQYYLVPQNINLDSFKAGDQISMSVEKDQYGTYHVKTIAEGGQKKG
jgi:hypothetical protein